MRLFVALRLDPQMRGGIEGVQSVLRRADVRRQVRWVEPHGIHLTFKFLGEVAEDRVRAVAGALEEAIQGARAPRLVLEGVGGFPNLRRPRVIWLGLAEEGGEALGTLQRAIDGAVEPLGWEREKRPFQPHLTLGRVREESRGRPQVLDAPLVRALEDVHPPAPDVRVQDRVALVRSHLSPSGARYEDLQVWTLAHR